MIMQYLVFEFDTKKDLDDTTVKLWNQYGVSGEMAIRPLGNGRWRLELNTEKDIRESTLEKFTAYRVEAGD